MENSLPVQERYTVHIAGGVSGQVAVGSQIHQVNTAPVPAGSAEIELDTLLQELKALKDRIAESAPPEKQPAALERVDELAAAVTAEKPDLTTMEYVRNWFARNLPALAGAVTSVIVNPIIGRLVEAAGDAVAAEFKRRFGLAEK